MHRRQILAATLALPLSGCLSSLSPGPSSLGPPEETLDADGLEKHLVFSRGGRR